MERANGRVSFEEIWARMVGWRCIGIGGTGNSFTGWLA